MSIANERSKVLAELQRLGKLSREDAEALARLPVSRGGRPTSKSAQFVREFRRLAEYLNGRLEGLSYDLAIARAANATASSERRIKGALTWTTTMGSSHREVLAALEMGKDAAQRVAVGGLDALSPKEFFMYSCIGSVNQIFATRFDPDEQVEMWGDGRFTALFSETWDRTINALALLVTPEADGGLGVAVRTASDLYPSMVGLAFGISNSIADRMLGVQKPR